MKSQRAIFKWIAIPIILAVFLNSALVLPSASAQDEFTPTPTLTPTDVATEPTATEIPPESTPTESATPVPTATEEDESAELPPPLVPAEAEPAIQLFSRSQPSGSAADNLLAGGDSIQSSPALAYNSVNREYLVVWVDNAEPASLRGRIVSEASVAIAEEFVITPGIVSTPTRLEIIYNSAENTYLVLWSEPNGLILGAPYYALAAHNLYVLQLASDGTPVSASPTLISNQVTFFPNDIRLSYAIAYNSNGNEFLVAWVQPPVAIIGNVAHPHRVMGQRLGPDGTLRGGKVTWKAGVTSSIALAYSPASNEYLVTWDRWFIGSSGYDLFAQRIRPDTLAVIGSDIALGTGPGWQSMAALTYAASTNDYFVTWDTGPNPPNGGVLMADTAGRRVHAGSGALVGSTIVILADPEPIHKNAVVYSPVEDRFLVIGKLSFRELTGRYVTSQGEMPEDAFQISALPLDIGSNPHDDVPRIAARSGAVDGAPNFVTAWKTNDDIYARAITRGGCETDVFEPDDSSSTGATLIMGEDQRHSLCPQSDEDWANFQVSTTRSVNGNLLVETFDLEPDSIHPNSNTQLTVLDESATSQIGTNQFRGYGPFPGSPDILQSSRVVWHPATGGIFNIRVFPEKPINEQAGSGYSLRLTNPLTLVDPVDQGSWAPTKVNVPFVTRDGSIIYFTQFFIYDQAELDALINLNATLTWEFRRPDVDDSTGLEVDKSNIDWGDYWQGINGECVGDYWTNLPNHTDEYSEESNPISGCVQQYANKNEEFELYIQHPAELEAGKVYYVTVKFHIHSDYQNSAYQFYISKVENCVLMFTVDYLCNVKLIGGEKGTANLIEGYLQPTP